MTERARAARRAYKRKWAREHPDNVRESQRKYWERRAEREAQAQKDTEDIQEAQES